MSRPRIDLEGVALADERFPHQVVAIFRYRTTEGLVLLIPESADVVVPWEHVLDAELDLKSGRIRLELEYNWSGDQNWLRGARVLTGQWLDRFTMK